MRPPQLLLPDDAACWEEQAAPCGEQLPSLSASASSDVSCSSCCVSAGGEGAALPACFGGLGLQQLAVAQEAEEEMAGAPLFFAPTPMTGAPTAHKRRAARVLFPDEASSRVTAAFLTVRFGFFAGGDEG